MPDVISDLESVDDAPHEPRLRSGENGHAGLAGETDQLPPRQEPIANESAVLSSCVPVLAVPRR